MFGTDLMWWILNEKKNVCLTWFLQMRLFKCWSIIRPFSNVSLFFCNYFIDFLSQVNQKQNVLNTKRKKKRKKFDFTTMKGTYLSGRTWHSAGHLGLQWVGVRSLGAVNNHFDSFRIRGGGSSSRITWGTVRKHWT